MTELSENALKVAQSRYFMEGENWEDCCRRVSTFLSSNETDKEWNDKFFDMIFNLKAIPGGRVLRNSGSKLNKIFNCHVLELPDSIEGIGRFLHMALVLNAEGGGVGCHPQLRPKGAKIKSKGGESTGVLSFLQAISTVLNTVESGGNRRSGLLPILDVFHPEIEEFIKVKTDLDALNNFNISVGVTNEFLDAVEKKDKWTYTFNGEEYGTVWAVDLFDTIIDSMLIGGEPGIVNLNNMQTNNSWYFSPIESTNLCQPGWATIITKQGLRTIDSIDVGDIIWSKEGWARITRKIYRGKKEVFKYKTTAGVFYSTSEHKIISNGEKIEIGIADSIDTITGEYIDNINIDPEIVMDGVVLGDGSVHKASNNLVYLYIGRDDQDYFNSEIASLITKHRPGLKDTAYEIKTNIKYSELPYTYLRSIPDRYKFGNRNTVASFLRGLYSANGSVITSKGSKARIQLATSSLRIVEDVQLMLSFLGIRSYYTTTKESSVKFKNGEYVCRESYIVNITWDREKFYTLIGFIQKYKNKRLKKSIDKPYSKHCSFRIKRTFDIVETAFIAVEDVYSLTVDNNSHTYWSDNCNSSNCGELELSKNQSCCLGSIVLPSFLTTENRTKWGDLADTIQSLVRMLDNALDLNNYSFLEMYESTMTCRRIGIGVMGLGDYLIAKKVRYGSDAALDKTEEMIKFIRNEIYKASIELSKEKGAFPGFNEWPYTRSKFVKKLPARIRMEIKKHGIRNCTSMAFAPAGTISLIADTTSGVEPLPMKAYIRKDRVGERVYIHPTYRELLLKGEDIPNYFVDALDLSAEDHFETTVAIQRLNDSSISKTQLLPKDTQHEQLKDWILEYARDLVGITVYRDGSREGQILNRLSREEASEYLKQETESTLTVDDVQCARGTCEI